MVPCGLLLKRARWILGPDLDPLHGELQSLLTICTVKDIVSLDGFPSEPQCEFCKG